MTIAGAIAKNTTYSITAIVMELVIGFFTGIILARSLGAENFGIYTYCMWFIGVAAVITNLGLGDTCKRYIPESIGRQNTHEVAGIVRITLALRIVAALVLALVVAVTSGFWAKQSGASDNQFLFILVAISIIPHVVLYTLTAIFRAFQQFKYVTIAMLVTYPLRLGLIIVIMTMGYGVLEILLLHIGTLFCWA